MERGVHTGSVLCIVWVSLLVFLNKTKYWPGLGSPLPEVAAGARLGVGTGTHTLGGYRQAIPTSWDKSSSGSGLPVPGRSLSVTSSNEKPQTRFFFFDVQSCRPPGPGRGSRWQHQPSVRRPPPRAGLEGHTHTKRAETPRAGAHKRQNPRKNVIASSQMFP